MPTSYHHRVAGLSALTRFCARSPRLVLILTLSLLGLCWWKASQLELRGDFVELLPTDSPGAQRFHQASRRIAGSGSTLLVLVESADANANRRFIDALEARVMQLPPELVARVEHGPGAAREFLEARRWLLLPEPDLERVECELEAARARAMPGYVELENPCTDLGGSQLQAALESAGRAQRSDPLRLLDHVSTQLLPAHAKFSDGYYRNEVGNTYSLLIRAPGSGLGDTQSAALLERVQAITAELQRASASARPRVGFAGDIPNSIAERKALEEDLTVVSMVAIVLILTSIVAFFAMRAPPRPTPRRWTGPHAVWGRRVRQTLDAVRYGLLQLTSIGLAVFTGCGVAFATAELAFGHLNAATSFLGSIIFGNGINYGIVYLARYGERRRAGDTVEAALLDSAQCCFRATWLASLLSGSAYAALMATSFRAFSEFGLIGATGMVACWCATFSVCPAAVTIAERLGSRESAAVERRASGGIMLAIARVSSLRLRVLALFGLVSCASLALLPRYLGDPWESDFSRLSSSSSRERGAGYWSSRANDVFGARGSPLVVLANEQRDVQALQRRVEELDPEKRLIERVESIFDALGGDEASVRRKLVWLQRIRAHMDAIEPPIAADEHEQWQRWRPRDSLTVIAPAALPKVIQTRFTERGGAVGTLLYLYPNRSLSQSRGENLLALNALLEQLRLPDGSVAPNASRASVFSEMIRAMERDGPRAAWLALGLVVVLCAVGLRSLRSWVLVLSSVLVGVLWMIGAAAALELRFNFLNFVAVPLTLGIGAEYAINVLDRIRHEASIEQGLRSVGGAVALCSLTTIFGYGALLFADSGALRSFGLYAIIGEFTCLLSAMLLLPTLLRLRRLQLRAVSTQ